MRSSSSERDNAELRRLVSLDQIRPHSNVKGQSRPLLQSKTPIMVFRTAGYARRKRPAQIAPEHCATSSEEATAIVGAWQEEPLIVAYQYRVANRAALVEMIVQADAHDVIGHARG